MKHTDTWPEQGSCRVAKGNSISEKMFLASWGLMNMPSPGIMRMRFLSRLAEIETG